MSKLREKFWKYVAVPLILVGGAVTSYFGREIAPAVKNIAESAVNYFDRDYRARQEEYEHYMLDQKRTIVNEFYSSEKEKKETLERLKAPPRESALESRTIVISNSTDPNIKVGLKTGETIRGIRISNEGEYPASNIFPRINTEKNANPPITSLEAVLEGVAGIDDVERADVLFKRVKDSRYHYNAEVGVSLHDPVRLISVFGYGLCDDSAKVLGELASRSGIPARVVNLVNKVDQTNIDGHVVCEMFYNGKWHMYDPDREVFFLQRDGEKWDVASIEELQKNSDIISESFGQDRELPGDKRTIGETKRFFSSSTIGSSWIIGKNIELDAKSLLRDLGLTKSEQAIFMRNNSPLRDSILKPHSIEYTINPKEIVEFTNIPGGHPYLPKNNPGLTPPYYANGYIVKNLDLKAGTMQVESPSAITDIDLEGLTGSVSFDGERWVSPENKEELKRELFRYPRYKFLVRSNESEKGRARVTFSLSPLFLTTNPVAERDCEREILIQIPSSTFKPYQIKLEIKTQTPNKN